MSKRSHAALVRRTIGDVADGQELATIGRAAVGRAIMNLADRGVPLLLDVLEGSVSLQKGQVKVQSLQAENLELQNEILRRQLKAGKG